MYLFENYCYADDQAIMNAIISSVQLRNGGLIVAVESIEGEVTIDYMLNSTVFQHDVTLPECEKLGFNQSYTGLTMQDAIDLTWLAVSVLVIAFGAIQLRKLLGV